MTIFALELEYEDVEGESHFELHNLYKTYDEAYWHWEWHVSASDKLTYKNYRITQWNITK
jgi:hypothetical protein